MITPGWRCVTGRGRPPPARRPGPRSCQARNSGGCPPGCCRTTGCASPASCAASRCCSKPGSATPVSARSPGGRITPRPPARSNGSSRPSRSGYAARPPYGLARTSPNYKPSSTRSRRNYNEERPHQGIGRVTPVSRWQATAAAPPADTPLAAPRHRPHDPTTPRHRQRRRRLIDDLAIGIGAEWAGRDATIIIDDHHATVFFDDQLVRHLRIDPTRRYQPTGRPRGGPRRPRHLILTVTHVPRHTCHPCCATEQCGRPATSLTERMFRFPDLVVPRVGVGRRPMETVPWTDLR